MGLACASGGAIQPDPVRSPRPRTAIRVATFNIQSARHGLDAVAAVIREMAPDILALQEVDKGTTLSNGRDQARELADRAGFSHQVHFRAANLRGGEYGVAILSRFPVLMARHFELPTPRTVEPRAVAWTILDVGGQEMSVYITHLSSGGERSDLRARQARFIERLMSHDPRPKVLMGDLNDAPDSPAVLGLSRRLSDAFERTGHGSAETFALPLFLPDLRLDYVLASTELTPVGSFVVRRIASDHFPLVADFELRAARENVAAAARAP
ncbi:MAG TPA: endonuclease/exonuclease/phosphatase family protein [Myxococcaceae bacterium]|nr:endonuclease/exonuclease/phosphatase family protein [Myxococcaceae bacterium]